MIFVYAFVVIFAMIGAVVSIVLAADATDRLRRRRFDKQLAARANAEVIDISTARLQHKLREDLRARWGGN